MCKYTDSIILLGKALERILVTRVAGTGPPAGAATESVYQSSADIRLVSVRHIITIYIASDIYIRYTAAVMLMLAVSLCQSWSVSIS